MVSIKEKSFNIKQFQSLIDYIDNFAVLEKLSGNKFIYDVKKTKKQNSTHMYIIRFVINENKGFYLYLYSNQKLTQKGFIVFYVSKFKINKNSFQHKLILSGSEQFEINKHNEHLYSIKVFLRDLNNQLKSLFDCFKDYIFL